MSGKQPAPRRRVRRLGALAGALAFAMTAALCPLAPAPGLAQSTALHEVHDPQGRFSISLPENWAVRTTGDGVHDAVAGIGPAGTDGVRPSVVVDVREQMVAMSAEASATLAEAGLRQLANYVSVQDGPTKIGGVAGYYRFFTFTQDKASLYQMQVYLAQGRQLYIITGTTRNDRAQLRGDYPLFIQIIASFRFAPRHARLRPATPAHPAG